MGKARAKSLSQEERSSIAKRAADQRWNSHLPIAMHEGIMKIGELELPVVVLPDETRVITQAAFLEAIGRSKSFRGGTGISSTSESAPAFLQTEIFKPYLYEIAEMPVKPISYQTRTGAKAVGYNALLLPAVAELYLKLRDDYIAGMGIVPVRLRPYVEASDSLIRGLANIGIIALVDEATGYQSERAKDALSKILEKFIGKELSPYVKTFPDEFYENMYRLNGLSFKKDSRKRPVRFGKMTNDVVYARLAPAVLEELKRVTTRNEKGKLVNHYHRRLTEDVGHPKLLEHLSSVISLMKISDDWKVFKNYLDRVHPKFNSNLQLTLGDKASSKTKGKSGLDA